MKAMMKRMWGWIKFIWWMVALVVYAVVAGGAIALSFFMPRGAIFGRK